MASFKIKNAKTAALNTLKKVNNAIADRRLYADSHEILKKQIRSGINPKTGRPYRKLKPSTIENRRRLAKTNPRHPQYSVSKANHTLTGSLLDGLYTRYNKSKGIVTISIRGPHDGYASLSGKLIKKSRTSRKKIVAGQKALKRPILTISKKLTRVLIGRIKRALRRV